MGGRCSRGWLKSIKTKEEGAREGEREANGKRMILLLVKRVSEGGMVKRGVAVHLLPGE